LPSSSSPTPASSRPATPTAATGVPCPKGWFLPRYGAGRLERRNIVECEDSAVYARASGHPELVDCLLTMAEVEWEHEQYFRSKVTGHPLLRLFPLWPAPPPRERIRGSFAEAGRAASREPVAEAVRG